MTKVAAVLLLAILAWILIERAFKAISNTPQVRQARAIWSAMNGAKSRQSTSRSATPRSQPRPSAPTRLVRCASCGTHVVEGRSFQSPEDGKACCSQKCVDRLRSESRA